MPIKLLNWNVAGRTGLLPRQIAATAARWEMWELHPLGAPQPERVLSTAIDRAPAPIEIHNAHIPPAPSNGLIKAETCEALYAQLARPS